MENISLISVYNNKELLNQMVDSSKKQINVNIEYVLVDNSSREFPSAAAALNYGAKKATGDYLVFLHQDIEFLGDDILYKIAQYLKENPNTLTGAAGVRKKSQMANKKETISSMFAGPDKKLYSENTNITDVFVLDECLFACKKELFDIIKFDEKVCDGWHLYAVDLCLNAHINNINVTVFPMPQIWHKSNGNADKSYYQTQNLLAKKYKDDFDVINTTNGFVYTNSLKRAIQNIYRKLRYGI